jgi:hypothetical protein
MRIRRIASSRGAEELPSALPAMGFAADAKPRLVHQGRRLKRVS